MIRTIPFNSENSLRIRSWEKTELLSHERKPFFTNFFWPIQNRVLFKLAELCRCDKGSVQAYLVWRCCVVEKFKSWSFPKLTLFPSWFMQGKEGCTIHRRFTTSRLCMPRQLRNILDENYIAFFLSGEKLSPSVVIGVDMFYLQDSWFLTVYFFALAQLGWQCCLADMDDVSQQVSSASWDACIPAGMSRRYSSLHSFAMCLWISERSETREILAVDFHSRISRWLQHPTREHLDRQKFSL